MATKQAARKAPAKPAPKTTAVAVRQTGTAVATLSERMGAHAKRQREQLAKMPSGAQSISFKGATMTLDGVNLGRELPVIVLATQFERTYYAGEYNADSKSTPSCYSRESGTNASPDKDAPFPQSDHCSDCSLNAFGSAPQGRGKACKEGLKMAVVHADQAEGPARPPVVTVRFSPLNSKDVRKDIAGIYSTTDSDGNKIGHTIQARTILTVEPDAKRQILNKLLFDGFNPDDVVERLESMIDEAEAMLVESYPAESAIDPNAAQAKKAAGRKSTRRF